MQSLEAADELQTQGPRTPPRIRDEDEDEIREPVATFPAIRTRREGFKSMKLSEKKNYGLLLKCGVSENRLKICNEKYD